MPNTMPQMYFACRFFFSCLAWIFFLAFLIFPIVSPHWIFPFINSIGLIGSMLLLYNGNLGIARIKGADFTFAWVKGSYGPFLAVVGVTFHSDMPLGLSYGFAGISGIRISGIRKKKGNIFMSISCVKGKSADIDHINIKNI